MRVYIILAIRVIMFLLLKLKFQTKILMYATQTYLQVTAKLAQEIAGKVQLLLKSINPLLARFYYQIKKILDMIQFTGQKDFTHQCTFLIIIEFRKPAAGFLSFWFASLFNVTRAIILKFLYFLQQSTVFKATTPRRDVLLVNHLPKNTRNL